MSLVNYTVPFVSSVSPMTPTAYLGPQTYGQAVAINSLLYDTPRYGQRRHPTVPPSPSRKQHPNIRKTKDNRDPYRNQYLQMPGHRTGTSQSAADKTSNNYDEYFRQPDYGREKSVDYEKSHREPDNGGYHAEENSNIPNRKATSREQPGLQQHQRRGNPPDRSPTYRQIGNTFNSAPEPGSRTSLHAVLDFDDDFENYDDEEGDGDVESVTAAHQGKSNPQVTPIEGPIFIKNGSVPVVPLYSYPVINNGTLVQIPILWTALSLALGLEIHGEIVRGVPCIKRFHQLFCPTAGNAYPIESIERFIDDNKALMKRMYGEFQMSSDHDPVPEQDNEKNRNVKRQAQGVNVNPAKDESSKPDSYFRRHRSYRQSYKKAHNDSGRIDACESKIEIVTPYWASNSAGKIRAIVNTQHFEQAIHQEVCSKVQTKRCVGDCGCEQKYKWHRLLAYDPDNDCKGIFMDWFLFPSCCVCRCAPIFGN